MTATFIPRELAPRQHAQMEADIKRLMPNGLPSKLPAGLGRRLKPVTPVSSPAVQAGSSRWYYRSYPMGGWVHWSHTARMQRTDQGQDFEVPMGAHLIAPGWGKCVHHLTDGPFPYGFGSPYAVVYIGNNRFGGRLWYLGHDNVNVVPVGHIFHTGDILVLPTHSLNRGWAWSEVGHAPYGYPMGMGEGAKYHYLFATPAHRWSRT